MAPRWGLCYLTRCPFQKGGTGIATGYDALVEHALPGGRAVVLQEWLGRWVPIEVAIEVLDQAEKRIKRRRHRTDARCAVGDATGTISTTLVEAYRDKQGRGHASV